MEKITDKQKQLIINIIDFVDINEKSIDIDKLSKKQASDFIGKYIGKYKIAREMYFAGMYKGDMQ